MQQGEPIPPPPDDAPDLPRQADSTESDEARGATVVHQWGGAVWVAQGPGPSQNGQVENVSPNQEVAGAIHTVAAHPTNADILYVGATNGGIWKTTNATNASPSWTPLTDNQGSLSIGALEFDPTDSLSNTLVAGIGRYSSFGRRGGPRTGLLKTTDGGMTWSALNGGGLLNGKNISGVAPRGNTIVASVNVADSFACGNLGIFRSIDNGASFVQMTNASTGFPLGVVYDLASDPTNDAVLYAGVTFADTCDSATNAVYKSTDTGASWTMVSNATMNALITANTSNLEVSVGGEGEVYVAIVNNGVLGGLFRSDNGNAGTWVQMDSPQTNENTGAFGLNPKGIKGPPPGSPMADIAGGQGALHFALRASQTNSNTLYIGGDRQPHANEGGGGVVFPNSIGANDFTGRLFRGDASAALGSQFVHMTHMISGTGGTASSSAPHADSREMVFDANGNMIEVDDGGVYRRTSPQNNTGDWFSINGDIQVTEMHDVAYSSIGDRIVSGNQDTGTTYQIAAGGTTWNSRSTADGGDVAIDDVSLAGSNQWILYSSFQNLGAFRKTTFDNAGNIVSTVFPALTVSGGGAPFTPQFVTPMMVNAITPTHLLIAGGNSLYESTDQGETITEIAAGVVGNSNLEGGHQMVYGGRHMGATNQHVIYVADDNVVHVRTTMGGAVAPTTTPFPGGIVRGIAANSENWMQAFVIDEADAVFMTNDAGAIAWTNITGNLNDAELHSVEATDSVVFVGGSQGLYMMLINDPTVWYEVGTNLPTVGVWDIDYNAADDVLVIGTLGRGAWKLSNVSDFLGTPDVVQRCGISNGQTLPFNVTSTLTMTVNQTGDMACVNIARTASNHPNAPDSGLQTGQFWTIDGLTSVNAPASGFSVTLTLPTNFTPDVEDKLCRYTGSGTVWDCGEPISHTFTANTLTRFGITQFSDWAAGNGVGPTAVELSSFTADANADGSVAIEWTTVVERNNAGFNLYRSDDLDSELLPVNDRLIAAAGLNGLGARYTFADNPGFGTWYYTLEDVDFDGKRTHHGPIEVTVAAPTAVSLTAITGVSQMWLWLMLGLIGLFVALSVHGLWSKNRDVVRVDAGISPTPTSHQRTGYQPPAIQFEGELSDMVSPARAGSGINPLRSRDRRRGKPFSPMD